MDDYLRPGTLACPLRTRLSQDDDRPTFQRILVTRQLTPLRFEAAVARRIDDRDPPRPTCERWQDKRYVLVMRVHQDKERIVENAVAAGIGLFDAFTG